jgi:hypothetical protein
MNTSTTTSQLIDLFGMLKAQAAQITGELDEIKTTLIEREGEFKGEGEVFRLSLTHSITSRTDWKAVALAMAKKAGVSDKVFDNAVAAATDCGTQWVARASARVTK